MSDLPNDGDVIEFSEIAPGSLVPPAIVTPEGSKPLPPRRYRVEKKPLDLEYLLIDLVSGHAIRVPAHEFRVDKWSLVGADKLAAEAKAKEAAEAPVASGVSQPSEGLLVGKPLSSDDDEEEVDEEEEDPVTKTKTIVKKKVKKKR
jgi:hypothetical protein